jgi:hypothetical protein
MSLLHKEGPRDRHLLPRVNEWTNRCRAWEKTISGDLSRLTRPGAKSKSRARTSESHGLHSEYESVLTRDMGDVSGGNGVGFSGRLLGCEGSGAGANRLEPIENHLEVIESGLEVTAQGRGYEVGSFGSARIWFGTACEGEGNHG